MKFIYFLFLVCVSLVFVSCEKDQNLNEELFDGILLKSVSIDNEILYEFTYNKAGLILEEKSKYSYSKHSYNNLNQLIRSNHYWDESLASSNSTVLNEAMQREEWVNSDNTDLYTYTTFAYKKDGELERSDLKRLSTNYESYSVYAYNQEGQISRRTFYSQEKAMLYEAYLYDTNGNLIQKDRFDILTGTLQTTTKYEFDNHPNPYFSFRGLLTPGQNTNANNVVKERSERFFEVPGFENKVAVKEYDYEYNSTGYPSSRSDGLAFIY